MKNNEKTLIQRVKGVFKNRKELILLSIAIIVFLASLGYFCYRELPNLVKPKIYYRAYTKEKGWTKWSKNGETLGNGYDITAIQVKTNNNKKYIINYNALNKYISNTKNKKNNEVAGNKKDKVEFFYARFDKENEKKYIIKYRVSLNKDKWGNYDYDGIETSVHDKKTGDSKPIKYIQIKTEGRRK